MWIWLGQHWDFARRIGIPAIALQASAATFAALSQAWIAFSVLVVTIAITIAVYLASGFSYERQKSPASNKSRHKPEGPRPAPDIPASRSTVIGIVISLAFIFANVTAALTNLGGSSMLPVFGSAIVVGVIALLGCSWLVARLYRR